MNQEKRDEFWKLYYKQCNANNRNGWAESQLKMLSEMLDPNEPHISFPPKIEWIKEQVDKIKDGIEIVPDELEKMRKLVLEDNTQGSG